MRAGKANSATSETGSVIGFLYRLKYLKPSRDSGYPPVNAVDPAYTRAKFEQACHSHISSYA